VSTDRGMVIPHTGDDFPDLNRKANGHAVRLAIVTPRGPDGAYVHLEVRDDTSGEVLVSVEVDPGQWWLLGTGGTQVWPAFISPHLDRVGKQMEHRRVELPQELPGDTEADVRRDVYKAVHDQLPADWHSDQRGWDSYDTPRVQGGGVRQRYTIVRRWVKA
jgi:hypothetical protein